MLSYHGPGMEYYLNPIPCFWHLQAVEKCFEVGHCLRQKYKDGLESGYDGPKGTIMVKMIQVRIGLLSDKSKEMCGKL